MLSKFRSFSSSLLLFRVSLLASRHVTSTAVVMGNTGSGKEKVPIYTRAPEPKVKFTEEELRQKLSAEQYRITQLKGTERAGAGPHLNVKEDGEFSCVVCGNKLFQTDAKFDSGTGWPSFSDVVSKSDSVVRVVDESHGMRRVEVICGKCGAHLGHVFDDGPKETTGQRYCINGSCLRFSEKEKAEEQQTEPTPPPGEGGGEGASDGAKSDS